VDSDAPGSRWAREARNGDAVRFFGPRGSLDLSSISSPILFGDETCFGLAAALRNTSGGKSAPSVFEVNYPKESANRARAVMAANHDTGRRACRTAARKRGAYPCPRGLVPAVPRFLPLLPEPTTAAGSARCFDQYPELVSVSPTSGDTSKPGQSGTLQNRPVERVQDCHIFTLPTLASARCFLSLLSASPGLY